ncbi:MAG: ATP synthase F1 subunit epsilon [Solirubrobacterales bacterium]|nr:ATP synthase F1 subunit epsilon [Solirubrobacterales bacterium]
MARTPFQVEVLTPEGPIFSGEVEMVSTRTEVGSIGILANHTPLLGMLAPAELKLYISESEIVSFAQGEGYIQVADNHALVLVEEAIKPDELVREELQAQIDAAEAAIAEAEPHTEAQKKALRDQRRAKIFFGILEA